jgi:hypothetical protein
MNQGRQRMIAFGGLTASEMDQLSEPARRLAAQIAEARSIAPGRLREASVFRSLSNTRMPGLPIWMLPFQILIGGILALLAQSAEATALQVTKAKRPRALVVWLRRFHQAGNDRFPVRDLFEQLSAWGLIAYTLSDDVVYTSELAEQDIRNFVKGRTLELPQAATYRLIYGAISFIALTLFVCGPIAVLLVTRRLSGWPQLASVLCVLVGVGYLSALSMTLLKSWFFRSKQFHEVYKPMYVRAMAEAFSMSAAKAQSYFANVKSQMAKRDFNLISGFVAMPVADNDWQQVVNEAVTHADAVFIDVTELSTNMEWELSELAKKARLENAILSFGFAGQFDGSNGWQHHPSSPALDKLLGDQWRTRCRKFLYPAIVDRDDKENIEKYMRKLAIEIYEAAVYRKREAGDPDGASPERIAELRAAKSSLVSSLSIVNFGVYAAERQNKRVASEADAKFKLQSQTEIVRAGKGVSFGVNFVLNGVPSGRVVKLTTKITFPPEGMTPPSGEHLTCADADLLFKLGTPEFLIYTLDNDWEIVPGNWTFEFHFEGRKVSEKRFTVTT